MRLEFGNNRIVLLFEKDRKAKIFVNTVSSEDLNDKIKWGITNSLFPKFVFKTERNKRDDEHSYNAFKAIAEKLKPFVSSDHPMYRGAFTGMRFRNSFNTTKLHEVLKRYTSDKIDDKTLDDVTNLMMYYNIDILLDSLNLYMLSFAKKMTYVMPLRAITQRYYRYNNYSVDSIDADGSNLPMFFNNLSSG